MNNEKSISIAKFLGSSIHTRESSARLMEVVQENSNAQVELDFSCVEYISRAFADQFYIDKLSMMRSLKKTIIVANTNESVFKMLESVAKTHKNSIRTAMDIPVYKFSSHRELEAFLLSN